MAYENEQFAKVEQAWRYFLEVLGHPIPTQLHPLIKEINDDFKEKNIKNLNESLTHLSSTLDHFEDIGPLKKAYSHVLDAQHTMLRKVSLKK